jgi:hypothetical protein
VRREPPVVTERRPLLREGDMADLKVVSREYKVALHCSPFAGDEGRLVERASSFWSQAVEAFAGVAVGVGVNLSQVKKRRSIRFYDTPSKKLYKSHDYIFRERVDADGEREVTLKFRHRDRYVAQDRDMGSRPGADDVETKFEEDIKAPFLVLYSYSTTQRIAPTKTLNKLDDVYDLYPGARAALEQPEDTPLEIVRGFTARELVVEGAELELGRSNSAQAECALIVWYDDAAPAAESQNPSFVEFSFKYGDADKDFGGGPARRAYDTLNVLHGLTDWVDPNSPTKTAFVYGT